MPQQLLDRSNVITILEQMSSETVPECMARDAFDPVAVSLLGSSAVMAGAQGLTETVEEFRFLGSLRGTAWMAYRCTRTGCYGTSLLHGFLPFLKALTDYHLLYGKVKRIYQDLPF
jgi:hypothetical protein